MENRRARDRHSAFTFPFLPNDGLEGIVIEED